MKKFKLAGFRELLTLEEIREIQKKNRYMTVHKEIVEKARGRRILDLGCGIGSFAYSLAKKYPLSDITAVDNTDYQIDIAGVLYAGEPNLRFQIMSAVELNFDADQFDCICFLEVIEHLEDPVGALKDIYRVLKTGGQLILSTNNVYYWRFFLRQIVYDIFRKKPKLMRHHREEWGSHFFAWDISTLCTLLKHVGFNYSSHFYLGHFGFYSDKIFISRWIDKLCAAVLPFFRTTVVILFEKK